MMSRDYSWKSPPRPVSFFWGLVGLSYLKINKPTKKAKTAKIKKPISIFIPKRSKSRERKLLAPSQQQRSRLVRETHEKMRSFLLARSVP